MEMKKITLSVFAIFFLAVLVSAITSETNYGFYGTINDDGDLVETTNQITDYNAIGFVCANDDCSQVNGTLWKGTVQNSGNDNQLLLTYPSILMQKGYGVFFYKEGYFPFEAKIDYYGTQSKTADNYFTKKENCEVPINHLIISHNGNNITVNVTLNAGVSSPVQTAGPLNYVPNSIAHLYAVDSKVDFRFIGPENVSVTRNVNLPASESREVYAEVFDLSAGDYRIEVESNTVDEKCINSVPNLLNTNIYIAGDRVNETLPLIGILSPEAKTYTNGTILVNLRSVNATSVWFNYNGTNVTYTNPVYINFADGTYTLTAYAQNNLTTAHTSVTFKVNTTVINDTDNNNTDNNQTDITPPASITNLNLVSRTKNSLSWNWTNPTDADFAEAIVYINGVNVVNTSSNSYTATGLSSNTEYTITVHTKDNSSNVNTTNISLTSKTLSDSNNNGGGGSSSSSNRATRIINDTLEEVKTQATYNQYQQEDYSDRKPTKKEKDYSSLLFLLLILTLLLLIIVLSLLIIRRLRYN